jgi:DNA-binding MarR family transcriptional regulator
MIASVNEVTWALREMLRSNGEAVQSLARRMGLGATDVTAIDHIISSPDGMGPGELAHRLGIRSASATALVDRLEAAGHVRRVPHPSDRRRQTVIATEHAGDEVRAALSPLLREIDVVANRLTPEEAATTARFLREVAAVMRAYAGEATK